jgi:hypothetical protein
LRVFGINSLDELPETEALSVAAQSQQLSADLESKDEAAESKAPPADYTEAVDTAETDVIFESGAAPTEN